MNFQPGDVVQLKSGGPLMTVSKIDSDGDVYCTWFNYEGKVFTPQTHYFLPSMLNKAN